MINTVLFAMIVVVVLMGSVLGKRNSECYSMGSSSGSLAGAENCKNLMKFCFTDGKVQFPQIKTVNKKYEKEVSFYGDCALSFTKGCLESCTRSKTHNKDTCNLWAGTGHMQLPIIGNKCQREAANLYIQTQCNSYCSEQAKNIQQNSYAKDFKVANLEQYVSKLKTQPLKWVPE